MQRKRARKFSWFDFASSAFLRQDKIRGCIRVIFICFLGAIAPANGATNAKPVWIDTDCAVGSHFRDIDDGFALLFARNSPSLRIVGISTTYGNDSLRRTTEATRELVGKFPGATGLAIHPGATSPRDLGRETDATRALAQAVQKQPGITYLALGPLTNFASFASLHPDLAQRIERVIFLGGTTAKTSLRVGAKRHFRIHDANVVKDPEAVRLILRTRLPITLLPLETASQIALNHDDLQAIGRAGKAGAFLERRSGPWLWFWTKFLGMNAGPVFDATAVLVAAKPSQLRLQIGYATVSPAGDLVVAKAPSTGTRLVTYAPEVASTANENVTQTLSATTP